MIDKQSPLIVSQIMNANYKNSTFIKSAKNITNCPDAISEVAFAGRSNAGKSSALNYLTNNKIARTSKTPGRTQLINYFLVQEGYYLVDLPGYGYAKVAKSLRNEWQESLSEYLYQREPLAGIIIVMDCRHPLQSFDVNMLDFCNESNLQSHILLTKSDKLSKNQSINTYHKVKVEIEKYWPNTSMQLFSSTKKIGKPELEAKLNSWLFNTI